MVLNLPDQMQLQTKEKQTKPPGQLSKDLTYLHRDLLHHLHSEFQSEVTGQTCFDRATHSMDSPREATLLIQGALAKRRCSKMSLFTVSAPTTGAMSCIVFAGA